MSVSEYGSLLLAWTAIGLVVALAFGRASTLDDHPETTTAKNGEIDGETVETRREVVGAEQE
jgi:hypothetical protein